jgi:serine/threonine protein kinase
MDGLEIKEIKYKGTIYRVPSHLNGGRYRVNGVLSRGGMGVIYEAVDTKLHNKKVLLKSLLYPPYIFENKNDSAREDVIHKTREMAQREQLALLYAWERKIGSVPVLLDYFKDHNPHIYGPHEDTTTGEEYYLQGESGQDPYITMNFFHGETISDQISADCTAETKSRLAKKVLISVSKILQEFHVEYEMPVENDKCKFEFIYCDLKPANIINTDDRRIVLIDFGSFVMKIDGELQGGPSVTPGYVAPEINMQVGGHIYDEDVNPSVDVYSLGATVYEILSGCPPLHQAGENIFDFTKIDKENNHWIPFLEKSLQNSMQDRFENMLEMRNQYFSMVEKKSTSTSAWRRNYYRYKPATDGKPLFNKYPEQWMHERSFNSSQKIFSYTSLTKLKNKFLLRSEAAHLMTEEFSSLNINEQQFAMLKGFAASVMNQFNPILAKTINCLPELLYFDQDKYYIITKSPQGMPFLPFKGQQNKALDINYLTKRIYRIIDMFIELKKKDVLLTFINNDMVFFDSADQPFMIDYTSLIDYKNRDMLRNPLMEYLIPETYSAPEIIKDRAFYDQTYTYFIGKLIMGFLLQLNNIDYKVYFKKNPFPSKVDVEQFLYSTHIPGDLKAIILNCVALEKSHRANLFELKRFLSDPKSATVKSKPIPKATPFLIINNHDLTNQKKVNFKAVYGDITIANNKSMFYKSCYLLPDEPRGGFLRMLQDQKIEYIVYSDESSLCTEVEKLIEQSKESGYVAMLLGNSISGLKGTIDNHIGDFQNVVILATTDYFSEKANVVFYNIYSYLDEKRQARKK